LPSLTRLPEATEGFRAQQARSWL